MGIKRPSTPATDIINTKKISSNANTSFQKSRETKKEIRNQLNRGYGFEGIITSEKNPDKYQKASNLHGEIKKRITDNQKDIENLQKKFSESTNVKDKTLLAEAIKRRQQTLNKEEMNLLRLYKVAPDLRSTITETPPPSPLPNTSLSSNPSPLPPSSNPSPPPPPPSSNPSPPPDTKRKLKLELLGLQRKLKGEVTENDKKKIDNLKKQLLPYNLADARMRLIRLSNSKKYNENNLKLLGLSQDNIGKAKTNTNISKLLQDAYKKKWKSLIKIKLK
jgi:hypothetical protein